MNEEEKKLLEAAAKLSQENNKILKRMQRKNRFETIFSVVKWIVIIILTIWLYVALQPFIEQMQEMIRQFQETQQSMNELRVQAGEALDMPNIDFSSLQNLLDAFTINEQ